MIAFKKEDPVLKRSNKILTGVENRLSLTFDHRIVDGAPAARFLSTLGEYLDAPGLWLL